MFSSGSIRSPASNFLAVRGITCIRPTAPRGETLFIVNLDSVYISAASIFQSQPICFAYSLIRLS